MPMRALRAMVVLTSVLAAACNCDPGTSVDGGRAGGGGTAGGSTAGGSTAGGSTAGGSTAGGSTAGGSTAGGNTAGGSGSAGGVACSGSFTVLGSFDGGPAGTFAAAVSRDGTTVVGRSGVQAFRWRQATGLEPLGALVAPTPASAALAVSADGEIVAGISNSIQVTCAGRLNEGFRWTPDSGMRGLGDLPGDCFFSSAYGISADGALLVGTATNASSNTASTWTTAAGWNDLGLAMGVGNSSSLSAVTPDKQVFAGTYRIGNGAEYDLLRISAGGTNVERLGDLDGGINYAGFNALSDDGAIMVGFGTSADGIEALRWTRDAGLVVLGHVAPLAPQSMAMSISADGTLTAGFDFTDAGSEAVLWQPTAAQRLAQVLASHGVAVPAGLVLRSANGITVVASQVSVAGDADALDGGHFGFVARYCLP